jgi:hypothetical protein
MPKRGHALPVDFRNRAICFVGLVDSFREEEVRLCGQQVSMTPCSKAGRRRNFAAGWHCCQSRVRIAHDPHRSLAVRRRYFMVGETGWLSCLCARDTRNTWACGATPREWLNKRRSAAAKNGFSKSASATSFNCGLSSPVRVFRPPHGEIPPFQLTPGRIFPVSGRAHLVKLIIASIANARLAFLASPR